MNLFFIFFIIFKSDGLDTFDSVMCFGLSESRFGGINFSW
jgi:hypothetical protein